MDHFFNDKVDNTDKHPMEAKDHHCADGNIDDDLGFDFICTAP
jgi:hypothetical protein